MPRLLTAAATAALLAAGQALADFRPDTMTVARIDGPPGPHWVWVDDVSFFHMSDGRAYLVDADSGEFLGMLSTGGMFLQLDLPVARDAIYAAGSYYPRIVRGPRQDVVVIFDPRTLDPVGEVVIPPKRHTSIPSPITSGITDDQQFLVIYNMTPAQSASVVDLKARRFAAEISSPGCALAMPGGNRRFHMICADGSLMSLQLDAKGQLAQRVQGERFFDPQQDPLTEKPVRIGDTWLFVSFDGHVQPVGVGGEKLTYGERWSLLSDEERQANWRIGGWQHLAAHAKQGLLYSLMHQGGADTHKDPGTEVWVYDVASRKRVQKIALKGPATSIQVTPDDQPLLLAAFVAVPALEVYSAATGEHRRTIEQLGMTIGLLQNY
jgi:methylamine dehydrogenase heavy chain